MKQLANSLSALFGAPFTAAPAPQAPAERAFEVLLATQGHAPGYTGPVGVYLSRDGKTVTDFHGTVVGTVTANRWVDLPRRSWVHGTALCAVSVLAGNRRWYGRGSRGLALTLRPYKGGAK